MTKQSFPVAALPGIAGLCFGQRAKLSPDLAGGSPQELVNIIGKGLHHRANLGVVKGAACPVPVKALAGLADDPDVAYISPDRPVRASSYEVTPDYKLQAVNADGGVAIIHSGAISGLIHPFWLQHYIPPCPLGKYYE